jgi:hypothetical protein
MGFLYMYMHQSFMISLSTSPPSHPLFRLLSGAHRVVAVATKTQAAAGGGDDKTPRRWTLTTHPMEYGNDPQFCCLFMIDVTISIVTSLYVYLVSLIATFPCGRFVPSVHDRRPGRKQ